MLAPLADRIRPLAFDDMVGQTHLLGPGALLRRSVESGHIPNMVFYGPPGTGKTTAAGIIAAQTSRTLHKLNATHASIGDIRDIIAQLGTLMTPGGVLLYLDEIQYFNKKQQQSLLEFMENGSITLIAATTENPYFYVYGAVLSRSTVFEFLPVKPDDLLPAVKRAFLSCGDDIVCEEGVVEHIAHTAGGDVRKSINAAELLSLSAQPDTDGIRRITLTDAEAATSRSSIRYDRDGDEHYDLLSAFQKSIRGSDPNAAIHYLARLLAGGDLASVCRRLMVTACEDIGLAYPQALAVVHACVEMARQIGMPEAIHALADAVILLATAPKSNRGTGAYSAAMGDIQAGRSGPVPQHLKDQSYAGAAKLGRGGYVYPHSFPNHYTPQQYLPDALKDVVYYKPGDNKTEQAAAKYWEEIKGG